MDHWIREPALSRRDWMVDEARKVPSKLIVISWFASELWLNNSVKIRRKKNRQTDEYRWLLVIRLQLHGFGFTRAWECYFYWLHLWFLNELELNEISSLSPTNKKVHCTWWWGQKHHQDFYLLLMVIDGDRLEYWLRSSEFYEGKKPLVAKKLINNSIAFISFRCIKVKLKFNLLI